MNRDIAVKDIYKQNNNVYPLLGTVANLSTFDFMKFYVNNYQMFDRDFKRKFGFMFLIDTDEDSTVSTALTEFRTACLDLITRKSKELTKIYAAYYDEKNQFSPVENYYRVEESENERFGVVRESMSGGHSSEKSGKTKETNNTTDINSAMAYNSNDWSDTDKNVISTTNEITHENDKDTFLYNNETKEISHENDKDKTISLIHGNIGVSESTDILRNFVDYTKENDFYTILFTMIREDLLYYSNIGEE